MDEFARRAADDRRVYVEEAAARRDLTPTIIEKDFWVCWTLRRLVTAPDLVGHITFKGGTSLSKAYGIIQRFSEDIDLTIRRSAPLLDKVASPMEEGISGNERKRRTAALKAAAQQYVAAVAMPSLARAIEEALGTAKGWSLTLDPDDPDQQTLLFFYPRADGSKDDQAGYIKPRVKLEFGARGDPEPFEQRSISPYLADEFPDDLSDPHTAVDTLSVDRTFWEKATILHALYHKEKLGGGMSRHYYDLVMLDRAGITDQARKQPELLARVVHNKSLMFTDKAASYDTAVIGTLRLTPAATITDALAKDYAAMAEMFMVTPPKFEELLDALADLDKRINKLPGAAQGE